MASSVGRPSLFINPPGILPTEYNFIDELPKTLLNKFAFQELQKVKKKQEAM